MDAPIRLEGVSHFFGTGPLRKQILFDISLEIQAGEIVIATGPSGSGKTTLLTLIGALRSAQEGSLRVLERELRGGRPAALAFVRRQTGYIFQAHNLLDALTALQNVELSLLLHPELSRAERGPRARATLEAVGLRDHIHRFPSELSGGQRQRVAIARALASRPRMILADEPTASLDKESGRGVVDIMRNLAKEQGATVLLVTHDNRILDVADRIIHLEDGRLYSFAHAVTTNTQHMMRLLAESERKGDLERRVALMTRQDFTGLLEQVTGEAREFLRVTEIASNEAFESMLAHALQAFTQKLGSLLRAERASIFLLDAKRGELWLKIAQAEGGRPVDVRIPVTSGIAGHVATSGKGLRVDDAYAHPLFNPSVDRETGFHTRCILCIPVHDHKGELFAVAQLLNRTDGQPFDTQDEARFGEFMGSVAVILEAWWQMSRRHEA